MKHDWQSVPTPPGIAALERDVRGFPITFVTLREPDGRPDFTTVDGEKIVRCITEGLCGLCGVPFDEDGTMFIAFIGGPVSCESGQFLDPPMHLECAEYAMQVCPHLAIDTSRYAKPNLSGGRELNPYVADERPEKFGIYVIHTGAYRAVIVDRMMVLIAEEPVFPVQWEVPIDQQALLGGKS